MGNVQGLGFDRCAHTILQSVLWTLRILQPITAAQFNSSNFTPVHSARPFAHAFYVSKIDLWFMNETMNNPFAVAPPQAFNQHVTPPLENPLYVRFAFAFNDRSWLIDELLWMQRHNIDKCQCVATNGLAKRNGSGAGCLARRRRHSAATCNN